jgi:predicted enzyme related to lactoylglutathione lyase
MVIHYVQDMDRASRFYTQAFQVSPLMESEGWTTLDFDSIVLALHILPAGSDVVQPNAGLNLEVENIEEIQADIESLGGHLVELREAHGHVPRVGCFKDSEGNGFELRQNVST